MAEQPTLGSFSTASASEETASESSPAKEGDNNAAADSRSNAESKSPTSTGSTEQEREPVPRSDAIVELYEDVRVAVEQRTPDSLQDSPLVTSPETPERYTTKDVPRPIPLSVGNWSLVYKDDSGDGAEIVFANDGPAYDERWGDGGGFQRHKLFKNTSGVNRDDRYHLKSQSTVGYTNPDQIRSAGQDAPTLISVPGHSPGDNRGDFSVLGGTDFKSDQLYDALVELLARLHTSPTPLANFITKTPETAWELTKLTPSTVTWEAPLPKEDEDSTNLLHLTLSRTLVWLYQYPDGDFSSQERVPIPRLSDSMGRLLDACEPPKKADRQPTPSWAVGITLADAILSTPAEEVLEAGESS